jgi:hypothetical protein
MNKSIGSLISVYMIAAVAIIAATASCTSAAPNVADIVGIHELKPSQESTLICASGDDDTLVYSWSAEKGTIKGEGRQVTWVAPDTTGDYAITVKVTNTQGRATTFKKTFKVTDNPFNNDTPDATVYLTLTLPSTELVTQKGHPKIWTFSEIECVVPGADESGLTYQWTAPTGKLAGNGLAEGRAKRVGWIAPGIAGPYKVSVTVTDKSGNKASGEVNFDVYCCRP